MGMIGNTPYLGIVNSGNIADGSVTASDMANGGNEFSFRNRIINGDMRIDQRNAGASVTPTTNGYALDRWQVNLSTASKYSVQQNAGAVALPTGFSNYLGVTSLAATALAAGDFYYVEQKVEGFNVSDLAWGTASAQAITVSFWVRSSLTGTFGGAVSNGAQSRSYPFTYSISVANTWEQKTVTIPGDTSGTWLTNNGVGIRLAFSLGTGTTYSGTANAWAGTTYVSATGAVSVVGTNGATFYITGVQLEAGSVATPFERRDYGRELAMCQRYCEVIRRTAAGSDADAFAVGVWSGATNVDAVYKYYVQKRAVPTISFSGTSGFEFLRSALAWEPVTSWNTPEVSVNTVRFNALVATGDTRGFTTELRVQGTNTITISAEL